MTTWAGKKQILFIFIHKEAGNEIGHLFHLLSDSAIVVLYLQQSLESNRACEPSSQMTENCKLEVLLACLGDFSTAAKLHKRSTRAAAAMLNLSFILASVGSVVLLHTEEITSPSQLFPFPLGVSASLHSYLRKEKGSSFAPFSSLSLYPVKIN